ncbi:MAG: hypothetical protein Q7T81_12985 [Pseudolabrys sp.]|nr:hypothetical protein [Pseudolabrys sp.]
MVKGIFLYAKTAESLERPAESRFFDIPRCQGCRSYSENRMGGAKFVFRKFVHAAREPKKGSFIRRCHMTAFGGLFKAGAGVWSGLVNKAHFPSFRGGRLGREPEIQRWIPGSLAFGSRPGMTG